MMNYGGHESFYINNTSVSNCWTWTMYLYEARMVDHVSYMTWPMLSSIMYQNQKLLLSYMWTVKYYLNYPPYKGQHYSSWEIFTTPTWVAPNGTLPCSSKFYEVSFLSFEIFISYNKLYRFSWVFCWHRLCNESIL